MNNNLPGEFKFNNDNFKLALVNTKTESEFDLGEKLSHMLKHHITLKHTSTANEKKSHTDLTEYIIGLEFVNSKLERKNEMFKMEILKKDEIISDMKIELNENRIRMNMNENKLKMIENTFSGIKNLNRDKIISENKKLNPRSNSIKDKSCHSEGKYSEISSHNDSSIIEELSFEHEDVNSVVNEIKLNQKIQKNFEQKFKNLKLENKTFLDDMSVMKNEIQNLKCDIEEKEKIIDILYQEIKTCRQNEHMASKEKSFSSTKTQNNFLSLIQNNLEYFELIRRELIEFLKYYGINEIKQQIESFSEEENFLQVEWINYDKIINKIQTKIEIKMDDIKYMLRNMNKINIIFKSLMVDFSKNLWRLVEKSFSFPISNKLNNLSNRYYKLNSVLEKLNISLK